MADIYSKVLGTLNGISLGDAYGMPVEMFTRDEIKEKVGEIDCLLPGEKSNHISKDLLAGETTDDTAFSKIICEVIIENDGKIDPMCMVKKIKNWADSNEKSKNVLGPSTKRAFKEIEDGVSIEAAGQYGTTDGASMRILPVGIISDYRKKDAFMKNVIDACLPTHNTNIAISGAMAVAAAVSCCVRGGSIDDMVEESKKAAKEGSLKGYNVSEVDISARIDEAVSIVKKDGDWREILSEVYEKMGAGVPIEEAVPAAISMAYYAKGDPMLCAKYCANIGGDTDTIGAMACGICGAYTGIEGFDTETINKIQDVNHLDWKPIAENLIKYIK